MDSSHPPLVVLDAIMYLKTIYLCLMICHSGLFSTCQHSIAKQKEHKFTRINSGVSMHILYHWLVLNILSFGVKGPLFSLQKCSISIFIIFFSRESVKILERQKECHFFFFNAKRIPSSPINDIKLQNFDMCQKIR